MNLLVRSATHTIYPCKTHGTWAFDDDERELKREALVSGIPDMIEFELEKTDIEDPEDGFKLTFSDKPFSGSDIRLTQLDPQPEARPRMVALPDNNPFGFAIMPGFGGLRPYNPGTWYSLDGTDKVGWLCPALNLYYPKSPEHIHARFEEWELPGFFERVAWKAGEFIQGLFVKDDEPEPLEPYGMELLTPECGEDCPKCGADRSTHQGGFRQLNVCTDCWCDLTDEWDDFSDPAPDDVVPF